MKVEFSDGRPNRGAFLVYLNGIEVPATDVSVRFGVWQFPQANISLPPDRELIGMGREDRLPVAVFYLDTFYSPDGLDEEEPQFRLLFEGEVTGSEYQVTGNSRTLNVTAVGQSAIFTQMFPFFVRFFNDIVQSELDTTMVDRQRIIDNPFVSSVWFRGLRVSKSEGHDRGLIRRPYDFVENLLRGMMGLESATNRSSAVQAFFAKWARETGYQNKWVPCPYLETQDLITKDGEGKPSTVAGVFSPLKAVQSMESVNALRQRSSQIGNEGSLWDMIQSIFSTVYHEVVQLPAPPMASVDLKTGEILGEPRWGGDDAHDSPHFKIYPDEEEDTLFKWLPKPLQEVLEKAAKTRGGTERYEPARFDQPNKIIQNVTKPQLLSTAPPMCNVVFASQTSSKSFSENYAAQPTRIYISDPSAFSQFVQGSNALSIALMQNSTVAFPPQAQAPFDEAAKNSKRNPFDVLLWAEEFFKGPVVKKHQYPPWFTHLSESYLEEDPTKEKPHSLSERRIYEIFASYEFNRERASQQNGHLSSAFDPYVIPGFPGAVLDGETGLHFFAYFANVHHSLGQNQANTTINYTFGQFFHDFFESLWSDRYMVSGVSSSDQEILDSIDREAEELMGRLEGEDRDRYQQALADFREAQAEAAEMARKLLAEDVEGDDSEMVEQFRDIDSRVLQMEEEVQAAAEPLDDLQKLEQMRMYYLKFAKTQDIHYSPASPFPDVRNRFQNIERASEFYAKLLHRWEGPDFSLETFLRGPGEIRRHLPEKEMVFDWRRVLRVEDPDSGEDEEVRLSETKRNTNVIGEGLETPNIKLSDEYEELNNSYGEAMKAKSRPVCTLEEYIDFQGNRGVRVGPVEALDPEEGKGAKFYRQIIETRFEDLTEEEAREGGWVRTQRRQDWNKKLIRFREKVIDEKIPFKS